MKLAAQNLSKNSKFYIPYLIASSMTAAMFYIMNFLENNPAILSHPNQKYILGLGRIIIGIFAVIIMLYINSFLMKRRQKEIGLYNVLGMEKRHIARIFGWETVYSYLITMACGFGGGILLSKLFLLLLCKLIGDRNALSFYVDFQGMTLTLALFAGIFLFLLLLNSFKVHLSHPVELLRGGNVGEKEPKANWFLAILGLVLTGIGYYIAQTVSNPIAALKYFFVAVILVIIGTYFLFIAGTVALLKLLKKNKRFYYKTNHFTAVSGLLYRMKQNAAGLASICVLATMVIVMISSTVSLNANVNDIISQEYPHDFCVTLQMPQKSTMPVIQKSLKENADGHTIRNEHVIRYLSVSAASAGNQFNMPSNMDQFFSSCDTSLEFISAEDYAAVTNRALALKDGETAVYDFSKPALPDTFSIFGETYRRAATLECSPLGKGGSSIMNTHIVVVKDNQTLDKIQQAFQKALKALDEPRITAYSYSYFFDTNGTDTEKMAFTKAIEKSVGTVIQSVANDETNSHGYSYSVANRQSGEKDFREMYGGLLFLGLFLSILFLMATVLIIYYKQISEGYDDAERFQIMQKVGMSQTEVKKSIHSQVLIVFFLPLIVAVLHMLAAFKYMTLLLRCMYLTNVPLFALCTVCTVAVFALVYILVYLLTTRTYYKIVSPQGSSLRKQ
jgi:putative ABC transport system permease protein